MRFIFSQNEPDSDGQDPLGQETEEHLNRITERLMGEEPRILDVAGLIDDDWQNIPREAIIEFLRARQADGYSDKALKWASKIITNQFAGSPSATLQKMLLNPGNWLSHDITGIMEWIDKANIPLSNPILNDLSKAKRASHSWADSQDQIYLAKIKPVHESSIVYKFADGWIVASVSPEDIDHENQLISTTREFYLQGPGDSIYSFKDKDGVTHSMVATHDDVTSESMDIWLADWDQEGPGHIKEWLTSLRNNGQIITSSIDNEYSEPNNARDLGEYLVDDIGLPINYRSWGGLPVDYEKQILSAMSDYDAYQYGARGRSRVAADNLIGYAVQHNQLKELEEGRQMAQDKCWEDFSFNDDDSGMTNKRPDEDDFDMESNAKAFYDAQEAYDEERGEMEADSGWFQFIQYMYEEIEKATANHSRQEEARKKAWAVSKEKLTAQEAARLEQEQAEAIATGIFQEDSAKGWYKSAKVTNKGISSREWSAMINSEKSKNRLS